MYNINNGYVGSSRSVRSMEAIENFEIPLSMFNRDIIDEFIDENEEFENLKNLTVALWKYAAQANGRSSWHHTGKYFQETNHYDLYSTAEYIEYEGIESLKERYNRYLKNQKDEKNEILKNISLGVVEAQVWGGTRKHPRLLRTEKVMGVVKGDWLYAVSDSEQSKYKVYANKIEKYENFEIDEYYTKLIKEYPQFKAMKRAINKKIKAVTK